MKLRSLASAAAAALLLIGAAALPAHVHADETDDDAYQKQLDQLKKRDGDPGIPDGLTGLQGGSSSPADLEELAKKIVGQMSTLRKLPLKHPVAMEVATREQIVGYVESRIKEEMKPEEMSGQELALKRLGLIPEKLDMKKFTLDLYGEQVAGYYDPFKQKFFIASWMAPMMQAPIMSHELTHALQDQSFNLKPFLTPIPDDSDATSARQAVVEGDAVVAMFAWISQQSGLDAMPPKIGDAIRTSMASSAYPVFEGAPAYFQQSLVFPYADGSDFVQRTLNRKHDWNDVDGLYKHLPASSEQVLHPEKYFSPTPDEPKAIGLHVKLPGWTEVHTDVLGELVVRTMMEGYFPKAEAAQIAEGWGGDRYRAFAKAKTHGLKTVRDTMVVLRSTWDTEDDAKEYESAWRRLLPKKYDGGKAKPDDKGFTWESIEDGLARVERHGSDVVVVDGAPNADTLAKTAAAAWAAN